MIDERVAVLARMTAKTQLADLDYPLAMAIAEWKQKLHGHGRLFIYLMQTYEREVARRADVIWRNLHRAHGSLGSKVSPSLRADLMKAFRDDLDAAVLVIRPRFDTDMKDAPISVKSPGWGEQLTAARDRELARYEAEIEHYAANLEAATARGSPGGTSYVFHGNVGAVVTGARSVANVVQNINLEQREVLLKALEIVKQAIRSAPEFPERDRRELAEFADEAASELGKDPLNSLRLATTLQTLATAVQGIASGPGAYEVLRGAAASIGISV